MRHTALDLNEIEGEDEIIIGDGVIDLAGPDRVQGQESRYEKIGADWYRVQRSFTYPEDTGATLRYTALSYTRLTGLRVTGDDGMLVSESYQVNPLAPGYNSATPLDLAHASRSQTWINRDAKTVTARSSSPDSQPSESVAVSVNGHLISQTTAAGLLYTFAYDALGQRVESTDPRTGTTSYTYDTAGRLTKVTDPASNETQFGYDPVTGERTSVTDAMSQATYTAYDKLGRVIATWGATYPVAYEYDAQGQMIAMATTREVSAESVNLLTLLPEEVSLSDASDPSYVSDLDITTWQYCPVTGLLLQKKYADGKGPSYTYTASGQLDTRIWAREIEINSATVPVTTTYTYTDAGELESVSYNDNTQGTTFTYDRLGRQKTVEDVLGTRTFAYDSATLALVSETLPDGTVIEREPDDLGRPSILQVWDGDPLAVTYQVNYAYDTLGRFESVTHGTHTFTYDRVEDSELLAGWTAKISSAEKFTHLRTPETQRNLIGSVSNTWKGSTPTVEISAFAYTNDAIGRRTGRTDSGTSYGTSPVPNSFGYNERSEVTSATMGDLEDEHAYVYDPIGNRKSWSLNAMHPMYEYTSTALNQYSAIEAHDATVISPEYDDDGNMRTYGGWSYTWDGENRLVKAAQGDVEVHFTYDYMSRRVKKKVEDNSTTTVHLAYIFDGWNLLQEIDVSGSTQQTVREYVWGLDISQSLQGAGGVGGLLAAVHGANVYYPCFDANGNITQYVDSSSGTEVARYDYDAFGREFHTSGDMADEFVFRFSTKYTDNETGLVYYGYRSYNPELGRWINRDPIGEEGGLNLYGFVGNAALRFVDPLGLEIDAGARVGLNFSWNSFRDDWRLDGVEAVLSGNYSYYDNYYVTADVGFRSYRDGPGSSREVNGPFHDRWISLSGSYRQGSGESQPMLTASPAHSSALDDYSQRSFSFGQTWNWHSFVGYTRIGHIQFREGDYFAHYQNDTKLVPTLGGGTDHSHTAAITLGRTLGEYHCLIASWTAFTGKPRHNTTGGYELMDHDGRARNQYHNQEEDQRSFNRTEYTLTLRGPHGSVSVAAPVSPPSSLLNLQNPAHELRVFGRDLV